MAGSKRKVPAAHKGPAKYRARKAKPHQHKDSAYWRDPLYTNLMKKDIKSKTNTDVPDPDLRDPLNSESGGDLKQSTVKWCSQESRRYSFLTTYDSTKYRLFICRACQYAGKPEWKRTLQEKYILACKEPEQLLAMTHNAKAFNEDAAENRKAFCFSWFMTPASLQDYLTFPGHIASTHIKNFKKAEYAAKQLRRIHCSYTLKEKHTQTSSEDTKQDPSLPPPFAANVDNTEEDTTDEAKQAEPHKTRDLTAEEKLEILSMPGFASQPPRLPYASAEDSSYTLEAVEQAHQAVNKLLGEMHILQDSSWDSHEKSDEVAQLRADFFELVQRVAAASIEDKLSMIITDPPPPRWHDQDPVSTESKQDETTNEDSHDVANVDAAVVPSALEDVQDAGEGSSATEQVVVAEVPKVAKRRRFFDM